MTNVLIRRPHEERHTMCWRTLCDEGRVWSCVAAKPRNPEEPLEVGVGVGGVPYRFQTSPLSNCKTIHFRGCKPSHFWSFVLAALVNYYNQGSEQIVG